MDLDAYLRRLVALDVGDALEPGVRLVDLSSGNGWRLTLDDHGREIAIEVEPLDPSRRAAMTTARFALSYRVARSGPALDPVRAKSLVEAVARRVAANEELVLRALVDEAARARSADEGSTRVREVPVTRALDPLGPPEDGFWGLSPYAGCVVGCRFCYADSRLRPLRRLQLLPEAPWGSYVDVRMGIAERLAIELETIRPRAVKLCPILSDPYQAVEARYRSTEACLRVLEARAPAAMVLVLTRTTLIARDADLLGSMPGARAGVSLPTVDDSVRSHFEPRAASVSERLATLRLLRAAGVRTFAVVQPILPGPLEDLADALAQTVESVRIDVLYGVEGAAREFADPRYSHASDPAWQATRAERLAELCRARGVIPWSGELPPS